MARIVMIEDLHAVDLGMAVELGLLHPAGAIVDDCLPAVEAKLIAAGKALPETDWLALQPEAHKKGKPKDGPQTEGVILADRVADKTKRGAGPQENK